MKRTVFLSLLSFFSMFVYAQTALEDVPVECIKPNFRAGQTIAFNYSSENSIRSTNGKEINYDVYGVLGSVTGRMSLQDIRKFLGSVVTDGNFTLNVKEATPYAYVMDLKIGEVRGYKVDEQKEMNELLDGMAEFFRSAHITLTFAPDMSHWVFTDSNELPSLFYDFNKENGNVEELGDKETFIKDIQNNNGGYDMLRGFFAVFCPGIFRFPAFYNNGFQRGHIEVGAPLSGKSKKEQYVVQDTSVDSLGCILQKIKFCYYLDQFDEWGKISDRLEKDPNFDVDKYMQKQEAVTKVSKDVYPVCVDISRNVDADGWINSYDCTITVSKNNTVATFTERLRRK